MSRADTKGTLNTIAITAMVTLMILAGIGTAIDTNDIDETCSTNNSLLKRILGTWQCSQTYYAEGWFHNYSSPQTITIGVADTYYNITGINEGETNGLVFSQNGLNITKNATYEIHMAISFTGGNSGLYEFELFVDGIGEPKCTFFRTTSSTALGNTGSHCIMSLISGNHLNMMVKDISAPAQNIQLYQYNFNIIEVQ